MSDNQFPERMNSRRSLLKSAVALGAGLGVQRSTAQQGPSQNGSILAYVGTYTNHGEGVYLFRMDPRTGVLTQLKVFTGISNPSWLAIHPSKMYLYAVNENFTPNDTVTAFSVNPFNGDISQINVVSSQGSGPAHLSVHPSGKYVLVANYGSGNIAVLPILANGALGGAVDVKNDADACVPGPCPVGPVKAQKAPPGSFAISGHDAPHAHMVASDPAGKYVMVNDLGLDLTIIWKFD